VAQPAAKDDAAIREHLLAEIQKERWAPAATANVVVHDGVVELWGVIADERQRAALKIAAENVPGVKAVIDHLVWVEPTTGMTMEPADGVLTQ
jgi:osmotically-inducible protein OsmY